MTTNENEYPYMTPQQWAEFGSQAAFHRYIDDVRAANEEAKAARQAKLKAEKDEIERKGQAQRDAEAAAAIEAYRRDVRLHWSGTESDFQRNWPILKDEFLRRSAQASIDAEMERMRASGKYTL